MNETHQKIWIDPPSGWMFGFPKIYDKSVDNPDVEEWIVEKGYPRKMKNAFKNGIPFRWWSAENDEPKTE